MMLYKGSHKAGEIEIVKPQVVFHNEFATVYNDQVLFPKGKTGEYLRFVWNASPGAAVLPTLRGNKIGLLRIFRHALRSWSIEIPRGFSKNRESPCETAARELIEETGFRLLELVELGDFTPDSGILSSIVHLYLARVELPVEARSNIEDAQDAISGIHIYGYNDVLNMVRTGQISDAYTIVALFKAVLADYLSETQ